MEDHQTIEMLGTQIKNPSKDPSWQGEKLCEIVDGRMKSYTYSKGYTYSLSLQCNTHDYSKGYTYSLSLQCNTREILDGRMMRSVTMQMKST
jgi:hypothetical protein